MSTRIFNRKFAPVRVRVYSPASSRSFSFSQSLDYSPVRSTSRAFSPASILKTNYSPYRASTRVFAPGNVYRNTFAPYTARYVSTTYTPIQNYDNNPIFNQSRRIFESEKFMYNYAPEYSFGIKPKFYTDDSMIKYLAEYNKGIFEIVKRMLR